MFPKRRFWKVEPTFQNEFSKHFATFCSPKRVLTPLKSASKSRSERLIRPSKIFVWEGYNYHVANKIVQFVFFAIPAKERAKVLRKRTRKCWFCLQNLCLGSIKLPFPNEDFEG
jgi:hypothetical protein